MREGQDVAGGGGGGERMIGISWWQCEAPSALGKEITPSFECTLTRAQ